MSVAAQISRNYRDPGGVVAYWVSQPYHEGRSLMMLMAGCAFLCVSVIPNVVLLQDGGPTEARVSAAIFAWLFVAPLALYLLAGLIYLGLRLSRARPSAYATRLVLFWSILAAAPLWLLNGAGLVIPMRAVSLTIGFVAFTGFLLLIILNFKALLRLTEADQ